MKSLKDEDYNTLVGMYEYFYGRTIKEPYILEAANGNDGYWIYKEYMDELMEKFRDVLNNQGYVDNPHKKY